LSLFYPTHFTIHASKQANANISIKILDFFFLNSVFKFHFKIIRFIHKNLYVAAIVNQSFMSLFIHSLIQSYTHAIGFSLSFIILVSLKNSIIDTYVYGFRLPGAKATTISFDGLYENTSRCSKSNTLFQSSFCLPSHGNSKRRTGFLNLRPRCYLLKV
jgi:hypothetical protein